MLLRIHFLDAAYGRRGMTTDRGSPLPPGEAAALLSSGVLEPGTHWLADALATVLPCRACGRTLRVTPIRRPRDGAVAVDSEGRLVFGSGSVSRDALGVQLCDDCYDLAGWKNTHDDEAHEEHPDPECPLCGTSGPT
jgi:hypothetical protein